jgi:hypothetical protein
MKPLVQLILLLMLAYLVLGLVKQFLRSLGLMSSGERRRGERTSRRLSSFRTVKCAHCGTYVAERRALLVGKQGYCSASCAESKVHSV